MLSRLRYVFPALGFAAIALFFAVGLQRDPSVIPSTFIDQAAPPIALPPLSPGQEGISALDLQGDITLVNIFASWCGPCRVEHPLLMRLAEQGEVRVYGINYKDRPEDAENWLRQLGDPYARIGVDRNGRAAIDWGVYGVPETFLIDSTGRIRFKQVGPLTSEVLEKEIFPIVRALRAEAKS